MKKCRLFFLPLSFFLLLGCDSGKTGGGGGDNPGGDTREPLSTPNLVVNVNQDGLDWAIIKDAVSYQISVNDEKPVSVTTPGYTFSLEEGNYNVSVTAVADEVKYNSQSATFSYTVAYIEMGDLVEEDGTISWNNSVGMGVVYNFNDGQDIAVAGESISASQSGKYTVKQTTGFDTKTNTYYVSNESAISSRTIDISIELDTILMIEDGSEETTADLKDKYIIEKYDTNGWVGYLNADVMLDDSNEGYTDTNCVKIKYFKHSANFRYQHSNVKFKNPFSTLNFTLKGNSDGKFRVSIRVDNEKATLRGIPINGVYATYTINEMPEKWTRYSISMNDENWNVNYNGTDLTLGALKDYLKTINVELKDFGELLPNFTTVSMICFCTDDASWSTAYAYIDDLFFSSEETAKDPITLKKELKLKDDYAFQADAIGGSLNFRNNNWTMSVGFNDRDEVVKLPVDVSIADTNHVRITSTNSGYEFEALLLHDDYSDKLTLESATGEFADHLTNLVVDKYYVVDDFESYEETGVGYDSQHGLGAVSGLRAAYYSDYYSNLGKEDDNGVFRPDPNPSPVGGVGWSLMGSTDYLELNKTIEGSHSGEQSGKFKYNRTNQTRFMTSTLLDGTADKLPAGKIMSFWTKGFPDRKSKIKIRAYSVDLVTPVNQTDGTYMNQSDEIIVPIDSDWTEIKLELRENRIYYGVCILPMTYSGDATTESRYVYVDDICIYDTISPFNKGSIVLPPKLELKDNYAFTSDSLNGTLNKKSDGWTLSFNYNDTQTTIPVNATLQEEENNLHVVSSVTNYDFDATFISSDGGKTLEIESVSGTCAPLLENFAADVYYILDDFESYSETGVGYDATHGEDDISGLRANYFVDYNIASETTPSPIDESAYSLMGSDDYLNINDTASNVHGGSQSGRLKYDKDYQIRYMTYGLSNGTSTRLPRGQYASVWVKWTPTRQCNFRLRLFTSPTVTADNFSDSAFYRDASVTILANNTEWVELRVELDPEQVYYGICLLTIKSTKMIINELSQYIYVDDICIYNSISPWGNN